MNIKNKFKTGLLASIALLTALFVYAQASFETVTIEVSYPPDELPGTTLRLYSSQDVTVPLTNWTVIGTVFETNKFTLQMPQEKRFFSVKASNFWGEGNFSSVVLTPAPVRTSAQVSIRRGQ